MRSAPACASAPELGHPSRGKLNIISGSAGGVPERLKGADCKSVGLAPTLVRIQPPPPGTCTPRGGGQIRAEATGEAGLTRIGKAGVAQWQSRSLPSLRRGFDSL